MGESTEKVECSVLTAYSSDSMPIGGPLVINHVILDGSSSIGLLVHCRQANKLSLVRRGLLVYTRQSPASPGDDT